MDVNRQSRTELLNHINHVSFVVNELNLYLDTHPRDSKAFEMFSDMNKHRLMLLDEYAEKYGPLTVSYADSKYDHNWNWITMPWPWQEGGC